MPGIRRSTVVPAILAGAVLAFAAIAPALADAPRVAKARATAEAAAKDGKRKIAFNAVAGKANTNDGFLTPGTTETLALRRMPKKAELFIGIGPSPFGGYCGPRCRIDELVVAPVPIRTDRHGRAFVSFTMPSGFLVDRKPGKGGKKRAPRFVPYQSGNVVLIDALTFSFDNRKLTLGEAVTEAAVLIP